MATSRYVGLAKETVVGTYVAPTRFVGLDSETLEPKPKVQFVARSSFSQPVSSHGYGIEQSGDITIKAARSADLLFFIRGLMGLETYTFGLNTPVSGVGQHTWGDFSNKPLDGTAGGTLATESVTINYDVQQFRYSGCWFNSLNIRQRLGDAAEFAFGTIGSSSAPTENTPDNTQAPPTGKGFGAFDPTIPAFDILLDGTSIKSLVKGLDIRIERSYQPDLFTAGSLYALSGQSPGPTTIRGSIMVDKTDVYAATTLFAAMATRAEVQLEAVWQSDIIAGTTREKFDLTVNKILFTGGIEHMRSGRTPPGFEGNFTFEGYRQAAPSLVILGENTTIA